MKKVIVILGVSGSGKTFLINKLLDNIPDLKKLTTITTRPKRKNELSIESKKFLSLKTFNHLIALNKLFLVNDVFGYQYAFDKDEYSDLIKDFNLIIELKIDNLNQIKDIFKFYYPIYIYPHSAEMALKFIDDRNEYELRTLEIEDDLAHLKNRTLPNYEMIKMFYCNHYDSFSIRKFISTVKKVLI